MHCSHTVHALFTNLKILKIGSTTLFTHLKIILLQCFLFSFFSFSSNKFNPNGPWNWPGIVWPNAEAGLPLDHWSDGAIVDVRNLNHTFQLWLVLTLIYLITTSMISYMNLNGIYFCLNYYLIYMILGNMTIFWLWYPVNRGYSLVLWYPANWGYSLILKLVLFGASRAYRVSGPS